jgi:2-succinyl-6-hydroxy-2,4-cyclohexadiene-1-carboxylate synthase
MEGMIVVEQYQFCYSVWGEADHFPILFLHGFMGDRQEFSSITTALTSQFRCLSLDLPGHGKTIVAGNETGYRMPQTAQAIISLLDQLNIPQCFLVGYSMGGRLALYLMIHFPERFTKVVLESASPGLQMEVERRQRVVRDGQLAEALETGNFAEFLRNWYGQPLFENMVHLPHFQQLCDRRLQNQPAELAKSLRNLGTGSQPSLWEALAQNSVPLLLLVGEFDQKFIQINQEMQARCEVAQLQIMAGCGHNIHFEQGQDFLERLRGFLNHLSLS